MINTKNSTVKDWIMLLVAIAITVLFMVFAEPIFTCFYLGSDSFADAMYDFNLYFTSATYISLVVWVVAILYYWILDKVKLSSFVGWAFFGVMAIAISSATAYFYPLSVFDAENLDFVADMAGMTIAAIPLAIVMYFIVSLGLKGLSTNCSTRPF